MFILWIFGAVIPGLLVLNLLWDIANFFLRPSETGTGRVVAKSEKPQFVGRGRYAYLLTVERSGKRSKLMVSDEAWASITVGQTVSFRFQIGRLSRALKADCLV